MVSDDNVRSDARPPAERERRAIVVVDVVESVRLMELDELNHISRWRSLVEETVTQILPSRNGRLVKSLGDGMLLEFATVREAVVAALDLRERAASRNALLPPATAMHLRIGGHVADVVRDTRDIYGVGVNLAARVASLAGPDEIVVTADFRDELFGGARRGCRGPR